MVAGQPGTYRSPSKHPSGARPPLLPAEAVPRHVAIIMDGNGRWAKQRGLPRTAGHTQGESAFFDVVEGALELGIRYVSVYAFSTENWRRSPEEIRFLMGFNRQTIRRRRDDFNAMGVRVRWAGRHRRLWRSVITELEVAERMTRHNDLLDLTICLNYGGRAELADAAARLAADAVAGKIKPDRITERTLARYLYVPDLPDVDLLIRSSGEQRISNYMIWQTAYAEFVAPETLWPDFDRRHLWYACELYAKRDRRFGGALPNPVAPEPLDPGLPDPGLPDPGLPDPGLPDPGAA
ncbi:MAG: isoprenyl transferase [Micromonosporaceae bacterium]|nr:isoprenyl transferase [Micromonosporaceae bacterium]